MTARQSQANAVLEGRRSAHLWREGALRRAPHPSLRLSHSDMGVLVVWGICAVLAAIIAFKNDRSWLVGLVLGLTLGLP